MYPSKSLDTYAGEREFVETTAFVCFLLVYFAIFLVLIVMLSAGVTLAVVFRKYRLLDVGMHVQKPFSELISSTVHLLIVFFRQRERVQKRLTLEYLGSTVVRSTFL